MLFKGFSARRALTAVAFVKANHPE